MNIIVIIMVFTKHELMINFLQAVILIASVKTVLNGYLVFREIIFWNIEATVVLFS